MRALLTGGAGYIGSHILVELLGHGHDVVVVDDFSSGHPLALRRVKELAGRGARLVQGDIADTALMRRALDGVDTVFHLAAYKSVRESLAHPERYFRNNLGGMASMLQVMADVGCRRIVYSSSAAVYSPSASMPLAEDSDTRPQTPYGWTKLHGEGMLAWLAEQQGWSAVSLRYFNPAGAHPTGRIGEHASKPSNLVPRALMALSGDLPALSIFGTDHDTPDGTALRDYIHVSDLARAHLAALRALERPGHRIYNVGTGRAHSVREVVDACGRAAGRPVPTVDADRRAGDVSVCVADPRHFLAELGFHARFDLDDMVSSAWRWWLRNPGGYG